MPDPTPTTSAERGEQVREWRELLFGWIDPAAPLEVFGALDDLAGRAIRGTSAERGFDPRSAETWDARQKAVGEVCYEEGVSSRQADWDFALGEFCDLPDGVDSDDPERIARFIATLQGAAFDAAPRSVVPPSAERVAALEAVAEAARAVHNGAIPLRGPDTPDGRLARALATLDEHA